MNKNNFSIKELLKFGWSKTKENYWFVLKVMVLAAVVYGASRFLGPISILVGFCVGISITTVALMIINGHTPQIADLFKKYNHYNVFLHYAIVSILCGLIVLVGFVLLILPGIYFIVRLQFAKVLVVDRDMKALDAIKLSWKMTEGHAWGLFLFLLSIVVLNILGAIPLGLGLLVTLPITMFATLHLYKIYSNE